MNDALTILLVDDEPNILKALQRLLRPEGYKILLAESGADGLIMMATEKVDLIISDMRMPEMDGAMFLSLVRKRWPDTMRLLLTGHADMTQTVSAINQGEIYRFIAKPWQDEEFLIIVRQALEQLNLKRENDRLLRLTTEQNEQLKEANTTLESKVEQRTAELSQLVDFLELTQQNIKESFRTSLQVFSGILEMRFVNWDNHSQRVSQYAEAMARALKLSQEEQEAVAHAALLHDVGKIAFPDALVNKSFLSHSRQERADYMEHAALGQMVLLPVQELTLAGTYIRGQAENFDGTGFPDHLKGHEIPIGARIIAITADYDELQMGLILPQSVSPDHAKLYIRENAGKRYDPELVRLFIQLLESALHRVKEVMIKSHELRPGMVLSRDLYSASRFLLLTKGRKLDPAIIKHIRHFEQTEGKAVTAYVRVEE